MISNEEIMSNPVFKNPDMDYLNYLCTWAMEIRRVIDDEDGRKIPYGTSELDWEKLNNLSKELDDTFSEPILTRKQFDREKRLRQLLDN